MVLSLFMPNDKASIVLKCSFTDFVFILFPPLSEKLYVIKVSFLKKESFFLNKYLLIGF